MPFQIDFGHEQQTKPRVVGIDLGTTNSLVGILRDGRPEILTDPASGSPLLPSAVSLLPDGSFLVGEAARRRALLHPRSSVLSVKRFMGLGREHLDAADVERYRFAEGAGPLQLVLEGAATGGPVTITPPEISSLVLRELTDHGSMEERPLGASEWSDKSIKLRHDRFDGPDVENRLWKDKGDWIYKSSGGGFSDTGFADCWVDKSK